MNKFHKLAAITALSLTAAFTYTCSSGGGGNDDPPPSSSSAGGTSSGGGSGSGGSSSSIAEAHKCGGEEYDTSAKGCCNANLFTLATQKCENNAIETKCGSAWYNAADANLRCESNVVETKCGAGGWYNSAKQMCDTRDSQIYPFVKIDTQTWLAKNLNFAADGSKCYEEDDDYCADYGRLYDWATAAALDSDCNSDECALQIAAKHKGVCPSGWHLPSDAEWTALTTFAGGTSTAGKKLKALSGWNSNGNGTDDYGFAALPGGLGNSDGSFNSADYVGYWWSSSENDASYAYPRYMYYGNKSVLGNYDDKSLLLSIRCLQD